MRRIPIGLELFVAYIAFFALMFVISGQGASDMVTVVLSISTFTFAIFLAFTLSNRHARLDGLRNMYREDDAIMVSVHVFSKAFGKKTQKEIHRLIEDYIISEVDYALEDFDKTAPAFLKLYEYITRIKPKAPEQELALDKMIDLLNNSLSLTKQGIYLARNKIAFIEWCSLIVLATIMWASMLYLSDGSIFAFIVFPFLNMSIYLLLVMTREIDSLRWGQKSWLYLSLRDLFKELEMIPYYADFIMKEKWSDEMLEGVTQYRVASYPDQYPEMTHKKVILKKVKK